MSEKEDEKRWTLARIAELGSQERLAMTNALKMLTSEVVKEAQARTDAELPAIKTEMSTLRRIVEGLKDRVDWLEEALNDGSDG